MAVRSEALMGTTVTIEAAGEGAGERISRAFDWIRLVERTCSRFDPDSELSLLSRHVGVPVPVSPLLFEAVRFALHVAGATAGAFDPTVGRVMWRGGFDREYRTRQRVAPATDADEGATYRDVRVDAGRQTITLERPVLLDLGAVAKGLAVDLAARELQPLRDFAVDAGGDLYLGGHNRDDEPWSIAIRHPRVAGGVITAVRVTDCAVCTSGDYERGGHIVDPQSGRPAATPVASVTVIADSAMLADALATSAFVLGPQPGRELLEEMQVAGLIVTGELEMIRTSGWPDA